MRWIRVQSNVADSAKVSFLADALGIAPLGALGLVVHMWGWASQHCRRGHIPTTHYPAFRYAVLARGLAEMSLRHRGDVAESSAPTDRDVLAALVEARLLDQVEDGWVIHDWGEWQGPAEDKAAKDRERQRLAREMSLRHRGDVAESSQRIRDETRRDEIKETTSVELALDLVPAPPVDPPPPTPEQARRAAEDALSQDEFDVFEEWRQQCRHPKALASPARRKLLKAALKDYTVEELQMAIRWYAQSPFHQGQNDKGLRYDDLELILRNARNIERGRDEWLRMHPEQRQTHRLVAVNGPPGHESEATHG